MTVPSFADELPAPPPGSTALTAAPSGWSATQTAAVVVAAVALLGSLLLWVLNQHAARRERRSAAFSEALASVERYMELPFRIRRRRPGVPSRHELAAAISDVQVELAHHQGWLDLVAPTAADAYRALVTAARRDAGTAMSTAWLEEPIARDDGMSLGTRFARNRTDAARARCVDAMNRALRPRVARWATTSPNPPDTNASSHKIR